MTCRVVLTTAAARLRLRHLERMCLLEQFYIYGIQPNRIDTDRQSLFYAYEEDCLCSSVVSGTRGKRLKILVHQPLHVINVDAFRELEPSASNLRTRMHVLPILMLAVFQFMN